MNERVEERLRPGGLDVLSSGLNLAELDLAGGEGFWPEVQRYVRLSLLERQVDLMMSGRSAPRVWAFLEAPGAGTAAAAAALGVARILADRGQAVVLVDADEQEPLISRWLGRTEQEGWIDMVRFGASLHAASVPLPSDSRRGSVLGVGSFAPTGVTPDEVADLMARLRRQADDLILVLPAKLRSVPWLELAQIRLLCWDLLGRGAGDTEKILVELERMGAKPDALLGFGVEEFVAIHGRLREEADEPVAAEPGDPTPLAGPHGDGGLELPPTVIEPEITPPTPEPLPEPLPEPDEDLAPTAAYAAPTEAAGEDIAAEEPAAAPRPRTSRVFVVVAAVAVVCLALLGVFLRNQLDPSRARIVPLETTVAEADLTPPPQQVEQAPPSEAGQDAEPVAEPIAEPAGEPAGEPETDPAAVPEVGEPPVTPTPVDPGTEPVAGTVAFDLTPFEKPVGEDGWALWLFSFPDEAGAAVEARRLERRGMRAAVRAVELPDQGRWFRVYTGSFANRQLAREAAPLLSAELRHDWVMPSRF